MNQDIHISQQFESTLIDRFYLKCIRHMGFNRPTPIQFYSLKEGLNRQDSMICQSKSGTGKTLSYLSLIFSELFNLQKLETALFQIVIVPTRQLAIQVYQNLRQILESREGMKPEDDKEKKIKARMREIKPMLAIGGIPFQDDRQKYTEHGAHIIVGTVGRIFDLCSKHVISLERVMTVTLDQGDKLWENKNQAFQSIIGWLKEKRLFMFSATYTQKIVSELQSSKRKFVFIRTLAIDGKLSLRIVKNQAIIIEDAEEENLISLENIHKFQVNLNLENSTIFNAKIKALSSILESCQYKKCLIFVQKKALLSQISERLTAFDPLVIHGSLSQASRIKLMNQMNNSKIILSSDLLARGIDFMLDLVVLFDARKNDTFWHRIGRTGRFGRSGVVISLDDIQWEEFERDAVNKILDGIQLVEKKEYYGKYLSDLSDWAQVNDQKEKRLNQKYRYYSEHTAKELEKEIQEEERIQQKRVCTNERAFSKSAESEMEEVPKQFKNEEQFLDYLNSFLSCIHCQQLMAQTTDLTGHKFEILKYQEFPQ